MRKNQFQIYRLSFWGAPENRRSRRIPDTLVSHIQKIFISKYIKALTLTIFLHITRIVSAWKIQTSPSPSPEMRGKATFKINKNKTMKKLIAIGGVFLVIFGSYFMFFGGNSQSWNTGNTNTYQTSANYNYTAIKTRTRAS